ncbi:MAG: class I SAM-dependent rRNA methyltransferase [Candidatus Omnitrophica bacterium]|nr:class I SAM-dependent rRNA methyltransferase [Candidatus Omnitrophota bacterium]
MTANNPAKVVTLKRAGRDQAYLWHPWIYRSQIAQVSGNPQPGELVRILTASGRYLGTGYFNSRSEITTRILSRQDIAIGRDFLETKLQEALAYRRCWVADTDAYRLVSSEADGLPGLIIDVYGKIFCVQILTAGMEVLREGVFGALRQLMPGYAIYEKSDAFSRKIEGLEFRTGWVGEPAEGPITVREGKIRYGVDMGGHKTGLYLDQRENRFYLASLGIKGDVLDAFCYEGGFGLHLASSGAKVLGVDIQEEALRKAEKNRELNGLAADQLVFKAANVFDELKAMEKGGRKFDLVILDPPSFVKKKDAIEGALSGYKEILLRSMKILKPDGLLAVFSCSYHIDDTLLLKSSLSAAHDARKTLKIIRFFKQSADHPINPFIPETYYLKGFLFSVTSLL